MSAFVTIQQFIKMLHSLDRWLESGIAYAQKKSFDANVLAESRLAPDQYPLLRQVQVTCDVAKFAAAHLSGKEAPSHPDTEKTMSELRSRIATCVAYLQTFKESDFSGIAERRISPPWMAPKWIRGDNYLVELAIPNFYFHATTAYAILRHNGVDLGKRDYIGGLQMNEP